MNFQKWQALICGAMVLSGPSAGHGESLQTSSDKDAFHFTAPVDFEPWVVHRSDGTFDGIIYRLAAEIAHEMGMPLKFHVLPFARLAKEGKAINFEVTITESDRVFSIATPVGPPISTIHYGLISVQAKKEFSDCRFIRTVVQTIGGSEKILPIIKEKCGTKEYMSVSNIRQRMEMVLKGRADAYLGSTVELETMPWFGIDPGLFRVTTLASYDVRVLAHHQSEFSKEPLRTKLQSALERILARDGFRKARAEFLSKEKASPVSTPKK